MLSRMLLLAASLDTLVVPPLVLLLLATVSSLSSTGTGLQEIALYGSISMKLVTRTLGGVMLRLRLTLFIVKGGASDDLLTDLVMRLS